MIHGDDGLRGELLAPSPADGVRLLLGYHQHDLQCGCEEVLGGPGYEPGERRPQQVAGLPLRRTRVDLGQLADGLMQTTKCWLPPVPVWG